METLRFSIEDLLRVAQAFAGTPRVMAELGRLLRNPNSDLGEITTHLKHDATLAARVLRVANSVAFAQSEPVASVEDAAALVGYQQIHRLVGAVAVDQFSLRNYPLYGFGGRRLRENSLFVALLTEELASSAQEESHAAYTVGLFRSIGKVVLEHLAEEAGPTEPYRPSSDPDLVCWEKHAFGISANEATTAILGQWHFPAAISRAIAEHYCPTTQSQPLTYLLNLACNLVDKRGYGLPGETAYWIQSDEVYSMSGVNPRDCERCLDRAFTAFERLSRAIG